jgi:uncharacterized protein
VNSDLPLLPEALRDELVRVLSSKREVTAVYIFGSRAEGTAREASDIDIGVLCRRGESSRYYWDRQFEYGANLSLALKTDSVDLVVMNCVTSVELLYAIVQDGILLYSVDPDLVEYELRIKREYEDHRAALRRAGY